MCPCNVDHWLWLALGFQGIIGMMQNLKSAGVEPSEQAKAMLAEQLAKLTDLVKAQ